MYITEEMTRSIEITSTLLATEEPPIAPIFIANTTDQTALATLSIDTAPMLASSIHTLRDSAGLQTHDTPENIAARIASGPHHFIWANASPFSAQQPKLEAYTEWERDSRGVTEVHALVTSPEVPWPRFSRTLAGMLDIVLEGGWHDDTFIVHTRPTQQAKRFFTSMGYVVSRKWGSPSFVRPGADVREAHSMLRTHHPEIKK